MIEPTRGKYNQNWMRNIIFSPDGNKLYDDGGKKNLARRLPSVIFRENSFTIDARK